MTGEKEPMPRVAGLTRGGPTRDGRTRGTRRRCGPTNRRPARGNPHRGARWAGWPLTVRCPVLALIAAFALLSVAAAPASATDYTLYGEADLGLICAWTYNGEASAGYRLLPDLAVRLNHRVYF